MSDSFKSRTWKIASKACLSAVACNARSVQRIVDQMRAPESDLDERIANQVRQAASLLEEARIGVEEAWVRSGMEARRA